jgi:Mor family transcriptional regulator
MKPTANEWIGAITIEDISSEHIRAIAESCGINDAISLMQNVPGIEIYVPKISGEVTEKDIAANPSMKIVSEYCGYGIAARLIMHRAELISTVIYIPKNGFNLLIKKLIEKKFNGSNATELALEFGVSDRHIQKTISNMYAGRSKNQL